jgi:putative endonuclease
MSKTYWVYILASRKRGVLYIGVTSDLVERVYLHRTGMGSVHVARYRICRLVYAESYADIGEAIAREKQLKKWRRQWKIDLIDKANPNWDDLYDHTLA